MADERTGMKNAPVTDAPPTYGSQDYAASSEPLAEQPPGYSVPRGPPPSYNDVINKIRKTRQESDNVAVFLLNTFRLIIGTIGCTIFLGIFLAIPISMVVIGAVYKDQCPVQPYIPIYLIVFGSFGIAKNLLNLFHSSRRYRADDSEELETLTSEKYESLISLFLFIWFIIGNVWIYRIYKPSFDPNDVIYCNQTLYLFAFWITTATYIFVGAVCACFCCIACIATCTVAEA